MYFKLSLKNARKSFRDYTLYFLTLTFSVCIFYIFNAIEAQKAMMSISASTNLMMQTLTNLIGVISVFVSIILGFLIVYANNFIIRRRKKELGLYMTLGMGKGTLARMLVSETFAIGVASLAAGLLAGIFLSQGLSVVTARLFEVDMSGYRFIFSSQAFVKTILYFGIIFVVVMILSTLSISRYKLIDLIQADKQNERQKLRSPALTIILFVMSIAFLGAAYAMVLKNGIMEYDYRLLIEIILGAVGTFLFFASLSGFFLKILQSNRKMYFRGLNMFILRQINARINTAHLSMSFICLMLFCTIGILSTGMGANNALNDSYRFCAPYDASFRAAGKVDIVGKMKEFGFNVEDYAQAIVSFHLYKGTDNPTKSLILDRIKEDVPDSARSFYREAPLYLIRLSEYNALMRLQGLAEVTLTEDQAAVYSDYAEPVAELKAALLKYIGMNPSLKICGEDLQVSFQFLTDGIVTSTASEIMMALVVPDRVAQKGTIAESFISLNLKGDRKAMQRKLEADIFVLHDKYQGVKQEILKISAATSESVKSVAAGSKALITFICIYLGLIFLVTSAAVLALQQLSEASDNRKRYQILQKVGADEKLIRSALFRQIAIYFLLPLALACVHSIVGIKVANDVIVEAGSINALGNIITTALLITLIYGSYFLATFASSKGILLKNRS